MIKKITSRFLICFIVFIMMQVSAKYTYAVEENFQYNSEEVASFAGNGAWLRVRDEKSSGAVTTAYFSTDMSGKKSYPVKNVWVDGRYINENGIWEPGVKLEDHPADIIIRGMDFTNFKGVKYTKDARFVYDKSTDSWKMSASNYFYDGKEEITENGLIPDEYTYSRNFVKELEIDGATDIHPKDQFVYDGSVKAGTPIVTRYISRGGNYYANDGSLKGYKHKGEEVTGFYKDDLFIVTPTLDGGYVSADMVQEELLEVGIWKNEEGNWKYIKENGSRAANEWLWLQVGEGKEYAYKYFDKEGNNIDQFYKETKNGETKYYLSLSGPEKGYNKGWWKDPSNGLKYYFRTSTGSRVEGRQYIDGAWKFFRLNSGSQAFGWQYISKNWTYFDDNTGNQIVGKWAWLKLKDGQYNWKYFDKNGSNIAQFRKENGGVWLSQAGPSKDYYKGWWTDPSNGQRYYFRTTSGSRVEGRQHIGRYWYFFRIGSGTQAFGRQYVDGIWRYYNLNTGIEE
ncbi:hypothetical protein ACQRBF_05680 [Peptoniphilaceae bacterium SGI.131]